MTLRVVGVFWGPLGPPGRSRRVPPVRGGRGRGGSLTPVDWVGLFGSKHFSCGSPHVYVKGVSLRAKGEV